MNFRDYQNHSDPSFYHCLDHCAYNNRINKLWNFIKVIQFYLEDWALILHKIFIVVEKLCNYDKSYSPRTCYISEVVN